jgi:hypothetical protein
MPGSGDNIEPDRSEPLSVGRPVLCKTRLLSRQCATCIFRRGNPMHLAPNRLRQLVAQARGASGYIHYADREEGSRLNGTRRVSSAPPASPGTTAAWTGTPNAARRTT